MREIKFRGKASMPVDELNQHGIEHDEGWVTGNLVQNGNRPFIVGDFIEITDGYIVHEWWAEVIPESIGQNTGFKDKNGKEIYNGYILKWDEKEWGDPYNELVKWDYGLFDLRENDWKQFCEVIGNKFENPELLEQTNV